jgi:DNA-binding NarL/FixJ family response regulator
VLLFSGDVLGVYGLLGLAICRLLRVRDRTLPALAGAWLVPVALLSALAYDTPRATAERSSTAGAIGYLLKDSPREEVFRAVRAAALGETVLSPAVAARAGDVVVQPGEPYHQGLQQRDGDGLPGAAVAGARVPWAGSQP